MKLKFLEPALAIGLVIALIVGARADMTQSKLSDKLLRLHVIANSDTDEDQALKLRVRDRVIQTAQGFLTDVSNVNDAQDIVLQHIPELRAAAQDEVRRAGYDYSVNARVTNMYFPTRDYDTFSLPAGNYDAFRVEIGAAAGRNWWCVLFPPLCVTAAEAEVEETAEEAGLTEEEIALISSGEPVYRYRFKAIEWIEQLKRI